MKKLTPKQRKFVQAYAGNAAEAARAAGYGAPETCGPRLLRNAHVASAIAQREKTESRQVIANRHQRQEFWTRVMQNPKQGIQARLKASELLGRSEADFTENHNHSLSGSFASVLAEARARAQRK